MFCPPAAAFRAWRETELAHSIALQNVNSRSGDEPSVRDFDGVFIVTSMTSAHTSASIGDADGVMPMEIDPETKNPLGMIAYESV